MKPRCITTIVEEATEFLHERVMADSRNEPFPSARVRSMATFGGAAGFSASVMSGLAGQTRA